MTPIALQNPPTGGPNTSAEGGRSVASAARRGIIIMVLGFGLFLLWASFVPLASGVVAPGEIVVDGKRKTIQHLEGGIIRAIHVREGELVKKDQILLELDQTRNRAEYDLLLTRYYTALATLDRFRAERSAAPAIAFSDALTRAGNDPRVEELLSIQRNLLAARRKHLTGQIDLLESQIKQLEEQVAGLGAERKSIEKQVSFLAAEVTRMEGLYKEKLTEIARLNQQQILLAEAEGQLGDVVARTAASKVRMGEARLQILQLQNERQKEIAEGILEAQERVFEVREQLASASAVLDRTQVRAPQDGRVLGLALTTIGGVVAPGEGLMQIVPAEKDLVIEAQIQPTDVDTVTEGMTARARLLALNSRTTPEVQGVVIGVAADTMIDEVSQAPYYLVRIAVPAETIASIESGEVVPGMPVELLIEGRKRTAMQYFLEPITDVLRRSMREG